nr:hypothetical protein [Deltaproteobacteria bacterium]
MKIGYEIELGGRSLTPSGDADVTLSTVEVERGVGGSAGRCTLVVGLRDGGTPALGDPMTVSVDAGKGPQTIFSGEVSSVVGGVGTMTVRGHDSLAMLVDGSIERSYEEVSAGFIVG